VACAWRKHLWQHNSNQGQIATTLNKGRVFNFANAHGRVKKIKRVPPMKKSLVLLTLLVISATTFTQQLPYGVRDDVRKKIMNMAEKIKAFFEPDLATSVVYLRTLYESI
jgi:hypothetical protein